MLRGLALVVALLWVMVGAVACQASPKVITIVAAASLTEPFDELAQLYQQQHPAVRVRVSYGSSATLAAQVIGGAPADVFASANSSTMKTLVDAGLQVQPRPFATNVLQIAVPPGNPGTVTGLADFAKPELRIALCAKEVPCGSAAEQLFALVNITPSPDTYEVDVKAALHKVELGEVDAALVYRTDVTSAGSAVLGIDTPEAAQVINHYEVAALPGAVESAEAEAFVAFLLGTQAQTIMRGYGFGAP